MERSDVFGVKKKNVGQKGQKAGVAGRENWGSGSSSALFGWD